MSYAFEPYRSPFANSIAETMLRRGDIAARQAEQIGAIQGAAAQQRGQAWAQALLGATQAVAAIPQQAQQQKRAALQDELLSGQVGEQKRAIAQRDAFAKIIKDTPQLDEEGVSLYDIGSVSKQLAAAGMDPGAAVEHLGKLNDAFRAEKAAKLALVKTGAGAVAAAGNDPTLAAHFLDQLEKNGTYSKEQVGQFRDFISADPGNVAKLTAYFLGPQKGVVVPRGATVLNPITNEPIAQGAPVPPTRAELAVKAAQGDKEAQAALAAMTAPQRRTESEAALDAYAKAIGKAKAEDLTDAERQKYEKRKAELGSNQSFFQHQRERQYDIANPIPVKAADQNKLEQEYRTVLTRQFSSRNGGIGLEDAKVQQANHLLALMEQSFDPKTGNYNIPKVQQTELALGLARLLSPNGTVGVQMEKEINQATALGDINKAITYITGTPQQGSTQDVYKMFRDSIQRQGEVAQQNREGAMQGLRALAPTELDEARRSALEASTLNPLRQSRVIQNTKTGERKVQVSIDGGKTWK